MNLKEFCIHRSTNHKPRTLKQLKGNLCSDRTRVPLQQLGNLLNAAKHNVCCAPCLHCGAKRYLDIAFGGFRSSQFRALWCYLKNKSGRPTAGAHMCIQQIHAYPSGLLTCSSQRSPNRHNIHVSPSGPPTATYTSKRSPTATMQLSSVPQPPHCISHRSPNIIVVVVFSSSFRCDVSNIISLLRRCPSTA